MEVISVKSVRLKILTPLIILFILSILGYAFNTYLISKIFEDGAVINIAGRQRMLTQRMSKDALIIKYMEEHREKGMKELKLARDLFDVSLKALIEGGETYSDLGMTKKTPPLPPAEGPAAEQLKKVKQLWEPFKDSINKIIATNGADKEAILYIINNNNTLLAEMNKAVGLLQVEYEAKLRKINHAS